MKLKRTLSLMLSLLMAFSLFAGITPKAEANDLIGDLLERYFFKKDYLDDLFNSSSMVKEGHCGINDGANVWYEIYEFSGSDVTDTDFFKTLGQHTDDGYLSLEPSEKYYAVKIFGSGQMENYKRSGFSAPWCDKVLLDKGAYKYSQTEVDMDKKLILAYVEGPADRTEGGRTVHFTGVTNVGQFAFFGQDQLSAVYLGETVSRIEDRAFESTEMLAAINMPSALEYLGKRAFYGCDKLTFWRAGSTKLKEIGERAFYGNTLLATVQFPGSLEKIDDMAFAWCRILGDESFNFPSKLKTIGKGAFMFDTHMGRVNTITIPASITLIDDFAFFGCFGIGKGDHSGLTFTSSNNTSAMLTIGKCAFAGCRQLKDLRLPNHSVTVNEGAFGACERLKNVIFGEDQAAKPPIIRENAFTSAQSTTMEALAVLSGLMDAEETEALPTGAYDEAEEQEGFYNLTEMTPLKDVAFEGRPTKNVYNAKTVDHSFPDDCVVHYPAADPSNSLWQNDLDSSGKTWHGYNTVGDWTGHFHNYEETAHKDATHTQDGYTTYKCTKCNASYTDTIAKGHDYQEYSRKDATCTEDGDIVYHCDRDGCSEPYYREKIPALGHDDKTVVTVKQPTCTEDGLRAGYCSRCNQTINEPIPAKGHNTAMMTVVQPTCTENGYAYGYCVDCHEDIPQDDPIVIPASGNAHKWDSGTVTKQPTCTEAGVRTYTCSVCGETKTEGIDALGHDPELRGARAATSTTDGYTGDEVCKRCGMTLKTGSKIDATGEDSTQPTPSDTTPSEPSSKPAFVDVKAGSYYEDAVTWAVNHDPQVTNGTDATHFSPNADCTRAQMVTFLWRACGCEKASSDVNPFTDVKAGTYYYDAVLWAVEKGITTGTSKTTFSPNDKVTRGQTVTFLWRMEGEDSASTSNPFSDVKSSDYYYNAVLWAVENDITTGIDATHFAPKNNCTRAQIVTFLWRDLRDK